MTAPLLPHERRLRWGVLGLLGLGAGILLAGVWEWPLPAVPCGFRSLSGLPCAMCGGTRAAGALLEGDWKGALYWNAMAGPVLAGMALVAGVCAVELLRGRPLADWMGAGLRVGRLLPVTLLAVALWWVAHVVSALRMPKPELVDLRNPVAAWVAGWLGMR